MDLFFRGHYQAFRGRYKTMSKISVFYVALIVKGYEILYIKKNAVNAF